MNTLLAALAGACARHPLREKLLVYPSLAGGHQLLEALARAGTAWINLRPVTPLELARLAAAPRLAARGVEPVSSGQALFLLEEVLAEMAARGRLRYFGRLRGVEGLAAVLSGAVLELRAAGVEAAAIDPGAFVDPAKGQEIKELLAGFEKGLARHRWADAAAIYRAALEAPPAGKTEEGPLYLVPEQVELEPLAFDFLERFTAGRRLVLPAEPVHGLNRPPGFYFRTGASDLAPDAPPAPLSFLYRPEEAPPPEPAIEIFRAYGAANEVRAVLRRLKKDGLPLDQCVACYTAGSTYIPLFYAAAAALNLPVTFGEGVPVSFTRPGRAALELLRWVEEDYSAPRLYRLLAGGALTVEPEAALARLLRRAGIGWGRERYRSRLEELARALAAQSALAREQGEDGLAERLARQAEQALRLQEIVADLLERIPPPDDHGAVDFARLCLGLAEILGTYARREGELDRAAGEAIRDMLAEAARSCPGALPQLEALGRLKLRLAGLAAGASSPRPGRLHITGFREGEAVMRRHTFVVGLEAASFPGGGLQDPVLLDTERSRISDRLILRAADQERRLYCMARFLASRRGDLTLGFSSYDVAGGRESFPAALLLQIHRLRSGCSDAGYSQLLESLGHPDAYFPGQPAACLTPDEWWLSTSFGGGLRAGLDSVRACFPGLAAGLAAREARLSEAFTPYDGKVKVDPGAVDPRLNRDLTFSPTRLEELARCPFAYFLRYLLRIEPPEELAYDPGVWLDALARGSLLHEIYCRFLRELYAADAASTPPGRERLAKIAAEAITAAREKIPPPGEVVFAAEKTELMRGLEVFLRLEEEQRGRVRHAYLEVPFGFGAAEAAAAGLGLAGPVRLVLPDGREIKLRGRIDRLDRLEGDLYRVWDYKTGGTYGFKENEYLRQGRQLQHALYALVAETLLKETGTAPRARVEAAGYLFPTEKGEGVRVIRPRREAQLFAALNRILDLLAAGTFCATSDAERCGYCDYQVVCRFPLAGEQIKLKLERSGDAALLPWKELQEYD